MRNGDIQILRLAFIFQDCVAQIKYVLEEMQHKR